MKMEFILSILFVISMSLLFLFLILLRLELFMLVELKEIKNIISRAELPETDKGLD